MAKHNIITSPKRPRVPADERPLFESTEDVSSYHHCSCTVYVPTYLFSDRFSKRNFVKTATDNNNIMCQTDDARCTC